MPATEAIPFAMKVAPLASALTVVAMLLVVAVNRRGRFIGAELLPVGVAILLAPIAYYGSIFIGGVYGVGYASMAAERLGSETSWISAAGVGVGMWLFAVGLEGLAIAAVAMLVSDPRRSTRG